MRGDVRIIINQCDNGFKIEGGKRYTTKNETGISGCGYAEVNYVVEDAPGAYDTLVFYVKKILDGDVSWTDECSGEKLAPVSE